jgi:hypothetical protein
MLLARFLLDASFTQGPVDRIERRFQALRHQAKF